jgi:hypothetical protein
MILFMPRQRVTNEVPPTWALRLKARRVELNDKSRLDIELETNGAINQKMLSRIEIGDKNPVDLELAQFFAYLKSLEWTPFDFERETRLKLPSELSLMARQVFDSNAKASTAFSSLSEAAKANAHHANIKFDARISELDFMDVDLEYPIGKIGLTIATIDPLARIGKLFVIKDVPSGVAFLSSKPVEGRTEIAVRLVSGASFQILDATNLELMGEVTTLYRDPTYRH